MAEKEIEKKEEQTTSGSNNKHHTNESFKDLLAYLFAPDADRMPELTDLPLGWMNTLTWMVTVEETIKQETDTLLNYLNKRRKNGNIAKLDDNITQLSPEWRMAMYKHRRSIENAGRMTASTLAMKQLELQILEKETTGGDPDKW